MYLVKKEMSFDSSHRLVNNYPGKCKNNHGHTWKVIAECRGSNLDQFGMLRDFGNFKPLKKFIDEELDHATIVSTDDDSFISWLVANDQKHFVVNGNPTSEFLCKFLFDKALELGIEDIYSITVFETCTSAAVYVKD